MRYALLALLAVSPTLAAPPPEVVESFDGTIDQATWRLGLYDTIETDGGSHGGYLRNREFDAAVPQPVYVGPMPSPFFGDYRAAGVTSLGIDVNVFSADMGIPHDRNLALVIGSDMGTPEDFSDDCQAFVVNRKPLQQPGMGWRSFDFRVPSASTTLPAGWQLDGPCGGLSPDDAWNLIITHVTHVGFPFAPPMTMWFYQVWDLGLDNVRVGFSP